MAFFVFLLMELEGGKYFFGRSATVWEKDVRSGVCGEICAKMGARKGVWIKGRRGGVRRGDCREW